MGKEFTETGQVHESYMYFLSKFKSCRTDISVFKQNFTITKLIIIRKTKLNFILY